MSPPVERLTLWIEQRVAREIKQRMPRLHGTPPLVASMTKPVNYALAPNHLDDQCLARVTSAVSQACWANTVYRGVELQLFTWLTLGVVARIHGAGFPKRWSR